MDENKKELSEKDLNEVSVGRAEVVCTVPRDLDAALDY